MTGRATAIIEALPGTYPFTLERSVRVYRLNKFLHELICPAFCQRFLQELESLFGEHQLTNEEAAMIEQRDWRMLIQFSTARVAFCSRSRACRTCTFTR